MGLDEQSFGDVGVPQQTMPTDQIVVIPVKCTKCNGQIEIDCKHLPGLGYMN